MSEHRHHGPWAVWLNDTDHVPGWGWTRLDVRPSNASHVTEGDAEWLRQVIREAQTRPQRHVVMDVETFTHLLNEETE